MSTNLNIPQHLEKYATRIDQKTLNELQRAVPFHISYATAPKKSADPSVQNLREGSVYRDLKEGSVNEANAVIDNSQAAFSKRASFLFKEGVKLEKEIKAFPASGDPLEKAQLVRQMENSYTQGVAALIIGKGMTIHQGVEVVNQQIAARGNTKDTKNVAAKSVAPSASSVAAAVTKTPASKASAVPAPKASVAAKPLEAAPVLEPSSAVASASTPKASKAQKVSSPKPASGSVPAGAFVDGYVVEGVAVSSPPAPKTVAQTSEAIVAAADSNIGSIRTGIENKVEAPAASLQDSAPARTTAPIFNIGDQSAMLLNKFDNKEHSKLRAGVREFPDLLSGFAKEKGESVSLGAVLRVGMPRLNGYEDRQDFLEHQKVQSTSIDYLGSLVAKGVKVDISLSRIPNLPENATPAEKSVHSDFVALNESIKARALDMGINVATPKKDSELGFEMENSQKNKMELASLGKSSSLSEVVASVHSSFRPATLQVAQNTVVPREGFFKRVGNFIGLDGKFGYQSPNAKTSVVQTAPANAAISPAPVAGLEKMVEATTFKDRLNNMRERNPLITTDVFLGKQQAQKAATAAAVEPSQVQVAKGPEAG